MVVGAVAGEVAIMGLLMGALRYAYFYKYYTDEVYMLLVVAAQVYLVIRMLVLLFKVTGAFIWRMRVSVAVLAILSTIAIAVSHQTMPELGVVSTIQNMELVPATTKTQIATVIAQTLGDSPALMLLDLARPQLYQTAFPEIWYSLKQLIVWLVVVSVATLPFFVLSSFLQTVGSLLFGSGKGSAKSDMDVPPGYVCENGVCRKISE